MRQGRVLSPRLFSAVQWAMQKWRSTVELAGACIDFGDGVRRLLDLRFADDIFLIRTNSGGMLILVEFPRS